MGDTYKTIEKPSPEIIFKDRKSKFFGCVFPIYSENEVKPIVERLKKQYPTANHVCYAWQLGVTSKSYRANDDGEPNNSAGMPIYGQIQSFDVTNVLVTVVRIFGGTKLGVGGLIQAYRTAAQMALEASDIVEKLQETRFTLIFGYPTMNKVMRTIKQNDISIVSQKMELDCQLEIAVRLSRTEEVQRIFTELQGVTVKKID